MSLYTQSLNKKEFWQLVQQNYGTELGLNNEEMENLPLAAEDNGHVRALGRLGLEDCVDKSERMQRGPNTKDGISQNTETDSPSFNPIQMVTV
ncbi:hypothetical protein GDO86_003037 [Hymenochirus boettgeri]|uniref:Uncharacterized protein n=1 Tax=Hymenochirus boettgeri TaxID=247094 RepID=A0A8T2JZN6_9PIPI|nr:hypothetical protein GDO86_003037 [Hymenochirus boettgeri]